MAEAASRDVLRFVDIPVERKSAWGPGHFASRQLEVDGLLLGDLLGARTGRAVEQSTPMVEGHSGAITPAAYLRALLGGPKDDPLREGRIAIGYCDACLDASCGVLLAADLAVDATTVYWSNIGFDQYDEGPPPKLTPFWKKASSEPAADPAHEVWMLAPFNPPVSFRFDREQYLNVVQGERRRLAAAQ